MLHLIWAILIQIIAALNSYLSRLSPLTTLMTIQKHFANHDPLNRDNRYIKTKHNQALWFFLDLRNRKCLFS